MDSDAAARPRFKSSVEPIVDANDIDLGHAFNLDQPVTQPLQHVLVTHLRVTVVSLAFLQDTTQPPVGN